MKFSAIAIAAAALAVGVSASSRAARQAPPFNAQPAAVVQANVGTITDNTNPNPQDLLIVLQNSNSGSQPLNGGNVQAVLSGANLPPPFTDVSCSFTSAQGPPDDNTDPPSPTCNLDTEIYFASTQDGFSATVNFNPNNEPFCMFCELEQRAPNKMAKREI